MWTLREPLHSVSEVINEPRVPVSDIERRYLIVRVPGSGPKALAGAPNDFSSLEEAQKRLVDITSGHLKAHHTYLEIIEYTGDKAAFLQAEGILV